MIAQNRAEKLAASINLLRPEWPIRRIAAVVHKHRNRPYRDLVVALAWVAGDDNTSGPERVSEDGPWWKAAAADIQFRPSGSHPDNIRLVLARSNGPGGCEHGEPRGAHFCPLCRQGRRDLDSEHPEENP